MKVVDKLNVHLFFTRVHHVKETNCSQSFKKALGNTSKMLKQKTKICLSIAVKFLSLLSQDVVEAAG